jgi:PhnB protein
MGGPPGPSSARPPVGALRTAGRVPDRPWTPPFMRLYVPDCEATLRQALDAGATVVTPPGEMPWGDRSCRLRDPFGNLWWVMTHVEDLTPGEEARRW